MKPSLFNRLRRLIDWRHWHTLLTRSVRPMPSTAPVSPVATAGDQPAPSDGGTAASTRGGAHTTQQSVSNLATWFCAKCGGLDIRHDAVVAWSPELGDFVVIAVLDDTWCETCLRDSGGDDHGEPAWGQQERDHD